MTKLNKLKLIIIFLSFSEPVEEEPLDLELTGGQPEFQCRALSKLGDDPSTLLTTLEFDIQGSGCVEIVLSEQPYDADTQDGVALYICK